ncbi:unnamed protein product [Psylliodes chrysocephalus]|uniref:Regulatory protein zeste n=1 Tax=Psylliodes chrysocephalus TaxID=3402493 RepID=A0A9P0G413_9CUCU|nr:unnamed protein product [Psylliodes chrysocephala]
MGDGKKREPNFTPDEKTHLFNIIFNGYGKKLEDKRTDRVSVTEKKQLWGRIQEEFNSTSPNTTFRSWESLKLLYENKKKDLRRKMAEEKKQRFMTGGGTVSPVKLDSVEEILLSVMNEKTIFGLSQDFDSDAINTNHSFAEDNSELNEYNTNPNRQEENWRGKRKAVEIKENWKKYKCSDLKLPVTPELCCTQNEATTSKVSQYTTCTPSSRWPTISEFDTNEEPDISTHTELLQMLGTKKTTEGELSSTQNEACTPSGSKTQATVSATLSSRRRPTKTVTTLTSSDLSAKYNLLLDRRLVLANKQIQAIDSEQDFLKIERSLKIDLLKSQIMNEKKKN